MPYEKKRGAKRSPIRRRAAPSAGESLRRELDEQADGLVPYLLAVTIAGGMTIVVWWWSRTGKLPSPLLIFAVFLVAAFAFAVKAIRTWPRIKRLALARDGERAVAEQLERELRRHDFEIFHDIPAEGFNVDHLVIGPTGVFAVETKTYRKPVGRESRVSIRDNKVLVDGQSPPRDPVRQARAIARWVADLLRESTGRDIRVRPVVVFPGWFVDPVPSGAEVWVLNEKAAAVFILNARTELDAQSAAQAAGQVRMYLQRSVGPGLG